MPDTALADAPGTDIPGEIEAKARDMGWKPKEEWEGDTSGWIDAEGFMERQDKRRSIVTEEVKIENEGLKADLDALKAEQTETRQTLDEFKVLHSKVEQKAYGRAMKDIQETQRKAVEDGDTDAFDKAAKEQVELVKDATQPAAEPRRPSPDDDPVFKSWWAKNKWYIDDEEMTSYADYVQNAVARKGRFEKNEPEYFDAITEAVKKKFPDKFKNPNRKKAAAVEEPSGAPARNKDGNGAADLPTEAREAGARFVKQGLYKNLADYAKVYFETEE